MSRYDMHLITQTPYECRPRIIGTNTEPQDGELVTEYYYNCDECDVMLVAGKSFINANRM